MAHLRLISIVLAAGALSLSACGDDEDGGDDGSAPTTTVTQTTTAGSNGASGDGGGGGRGDGYFEDGDVQVDELTGFTSPTGNIGCLFEVESVRCDVSERDWAPPPRPASCELDYGQGLSLRAGAAADFVCAGDTALSSGDPLPYGESISAGSLLCESSESGVRCSDRETGRGFSISREAYEIF